MSIRRIFLIASCVFAIGMLTACETLEERAEAHYQSAIALLSEGDIDRAIVELRNVFDLNGSHLEARTIYAGLLRDQGNFRESIGQYLRLVEQYPEDLNGNRALAELFAEIGRWPEMERYLTAVLAIEPEDARSRALKVVFDYHRAIEQKDNEMLESIVVSARELKQELPNNISVRQVIIDSLIQRSLYGSALKELDEAIEIEPDQRDLYVVRLSLLGALEDYTEIEAQLRNMIDRFPGDDSSRQTLVQWYISQNQLDEAESFLRSAIDPNSVDLTASLTLLRFIAKLRGPETAIAELEKMIAEGQDAPVFLALKAGLLFELGETKQAIDDSQTLLIGLAPSDESRMIKMALMQMLLLTGDEAGARLLVDEVLAEDKTHVGALKQSAGWLIGDDQVDLAITALRTALDQQPRDAEIITLMARAHERDGSHELVGEMLSLAVEAADRAPVESVRYAQYLFADGKFVTAEGVLIDALRLNPSNVGILSALGGSYLGQKDWARAQQLIETLRKLEIDEATISANELNARLLQAQGDITGAIGFLEKLVLEGSAGFNANFSIVRTHIGLGEFEKAQSYVDSLLADDPKNLGVLYMDAAIDAATGDLAGAEATYRLLLQENDQDVQVWIALFRLLMADGRPQEAEDLITQALTALPDEPTLDWIRAGILENAGEFEAAIAIYERLYESDSSNLIVANNLASLLTTARDDPESIQRAFTIAKRLRLSGISPYQDTYGWIAYKRGDFEVAVKSLAAAAVGLPDDPSVQYHLALAYDAVNRPRDAALQYAKVVDLTGPADTRDFVVFSRKEIQRIEKVLNDAPSE